MGQSSDIECTQENNNNNLQIEDEMVETQNFNGADDVQAVDDEEHDESDHQDDDEAASDETLRQPLIITEEIEVPPFIHLNEDNVEREEEEENPQLIDDCEVATSSADSAVSYSWQPIQVYFPVANHPIQI